jgi:FdhE protein
LTTRDDWLRSHPYLASVAQFSAEVAGAVEAIPSPAVAMPVWDDFKIEFGTGVPLLRSEALDLDLEPVESIVRSLVSALASRSSSDKLSADARVLKAELERPHKIVEWLLGDDLFTPSSPGLLRFAAWTATSRYLRPVFDSFAAWRGDDSWLRSYCPACGSLPAMAQLVGVDPGRKRYLACGACRSRWRYRRTACPFCENDSLRLGIVAVEGEAGLRIDYCESCRGYLKTLNGEGHESLLLADWSSLHLDVIACDRGLKRLAASLYELESSLVP